MSSIVPSVRRVLIAALCGAAIAGLATCGGGSGGGGENDGNRSPDLPLALSLPDPELSDGGGTNSANNLYDAVINSFEVSDLQVYVGETITLIVEFSTPQPAGRPTSVPDSVEIGFYQSKDPSISSEDEGVGIGTVNSPSPGEFIVLLQLTTPELPGIYYYGVCVGGTPGDAGTGNICTPPDKAVEVVVRAAPESSQPASGTSLSELRIELHSLPSEVRIGELFTLLGTVYNTSSVEISPVYLKYYESDDAVVDDSDIMGNDAMLIGIDYVKPLAPSESSDEGVVLRYHQTGTDTSPLPRTVYYFACISVSLADQVDRANCMDKPVEVRVTASTDDAPTPGDGPPDLAVTLFSASPETARPGQLILLEAAIENMESAENQRVGRSGKAKLRYYMSQENLRDRQIIRSSDGVEIDSDDVPSLRPGDGGRENANIRVESVAGTYYYYACVDPADREENRDNNCTPPSEVAEVVVAESDTPNTNGRY